jgi:segregation and condensation protein A
VNSISVKNDEIPLLESMGQGIDPEFLKTLKELGVDKDELELSDDVLCEPVEILVNLAKSESINPWDIDIVEITDKFLEKIEEMKIMDLRISGRTLLYASILLRMKSTGITQQEDEETDEEEPYDDLEFQDEEDYPVPKLPIRRAATRPVTLQELINELKKAENVESRRTQRRQKRVLHMEEEPTTEDVLGIAHEEDIKGRVEDLEDIIEEILHGKEKVSFTEIVEPIPSRSERIMTYLSLLFMASQRKICLRQDELFGELYIYSYGNKEQPV